MSTQGCEEAQRECQEEELPPMLIANVLVGSGDPSPAQTSHSLLLLSTPGSPEKVLGLLAASEEMEPGVSKKLWNVVVNERRRCSIVFLVVCGGQQSLKLLQSQNSFKSPVLHHLRHDHLLITNSSLACGRQSC